ncbi:hypothetical protein [Microbacterium sp. VKM Ac-2923]|uniref:hypothetical protein n=1 Tax=Microbacterium sp. VKM Ac-2923 TaxID=2929476 RepID=UPI001FB4F694|nr:hypothetical protein [Microbacterium sp. VKM Ac-2923]MCJ1706157.1 hypothetical protein [Microbacterium sp. VKM Ac-2923]
MMERIGHGELDATPPLVPTIVAVVGVVFVALNIEVHRPLLSVTPDGLSNETPRVGEENVTVRPTATFLAESRTVEVTRMPPPDTGATDVVIANVSTVSVATAVTPPETAEMVGFPVLADEATVAFVRKVPSPCVTPVEAENVMDDDDEVSVTDCPALGAPAESVTVATTSVVSPAATVEGESVSASEFGCDAAKAGLVPTATTAGTAKADAARIARRESGNDAGM